MLITGIKKEPYIFIIQFLKLTNILLKIQLLKNQYKYIGYKQSVNKLKLQVL